MNLNPGCPVAFKHRTVLIAVVLKPTPQQLPKRLNNLSPGVPLCSSSQLEFSNVWKHFTRRHLWEGEKVMQEPGTDFLQAARLA